MVHPRVWDDVDIQLRGEGDEPFCKGDPVEPRPPGDLAAAQHDLGDAGKARKLRDLFCHIVAVHGFDGRAQLLSQVDVGPEPGSVRLGHPLKLLRLHKQCGKSAPKGPGHPGGGADDLGVGGGGGETHKNVFMGVVLYPALGLPGVAGRPVRAAAQADLPKRAQL